MTLAVRGAFLVLLFAAGMKAGSLACPATGLHARYYTNLTRSGPPIVDTIDQEVSTDTLGNGQARVWTQFSAEWDGFILIDRPGPYTFATTSDDGSELEIDGQVIVRNGGPHGMQLASGTVELSTGIYPIRVRYEQAGGRFGLDLQYAVGGEDLRTIPRDHLFPSGLSLTGYRVRRAMPFAAGLVLVALWVAYDRTRGPSRAHPAAAWLAALDRPAVAVAILVIVGVVARALMMAGSSAILWPDSIVFFETVRTIERGGYLDHDPFRTLLYPYFLAAFLHWGWTTTTATLIVATQHLMGVAAAVCCYFAGREALGSRIAFAGALLFSVHTMALFYEASILTEALFVFVLSAAVLAMSRIVAQPSVAGAAWAALLCAAVTFVRPVGQWFVIIPLGLICWGLPSWRRRAAAAAAALAVFAALLVPWAMSNQRQYGFFGVAIGRGLGLFTRTFEIDRFEPAEPTAYPEVRDVFVRARAGRPTVPANVVGIILDREYGYTAADTDELMFRFALETIRRHPWQFAANSIEQWAVQLGGFLGGVRFCSSPNGAYLCSGRTGDYAEPGFLAHPGSGDARAREWVVWYFRNAAIPMRVVLVLALFGAVWCWSERRDGQRVALFIGLTVAYFTLVPAMTQWPQDRYRLPIDAFLFMFAAAGVAAVVECLRPGARQPWA